MRPVPCSQVSKAVDGPYMGDGSSVACASHVDRPRVSDRPIVGVALRKLFESFLLSHVIQPLVFHSMFFNSL